MRRLLDSSQTDRPAGEAPQIIEEGVDDDAEGERRHRQMMPAQAEQRQADDIPHRERRHRRDDEREPGVPVRLRRQQPDGIRTDGEKAPLPE